MKNRFFLAGFLLLAPATGMLIPGCGGGGSGATLPTATPNATTTATPTPLPTITTIGAATANIIVFSNGDANFGSSTFLSIQSLVSGNRSRYTITLTDTLGRTLVLSGLNAETATKGTTYSLGGSLTTLEATAGDSSWGNAGASTGSIRVQDVSDKKITFQLQGIFLSPSFLHPSEAKDQLFLSGTITATIS